MFRTANQTSSGNYLSNLQARRSQFCRCLAMETWLWSTHTLRLQLKLTVGWVGVCLFLGNSTTQITTLSCCSFLTSLLCCLKEAVHCTTLYSRSPQAGAEHRKAKLRLFYCDCVLLSSPCLPLHAGQRFLGNITPCSQGLRRVIWTIVCCFGNTLTWSSTRPVCIQTNERRMPKTYRGIVQCWQSELTQVKLMSFYCTGSALNIMGVVSSKNGHGDPVVILFQWSF